MTAGYLGAEDEKILVLARSARARAGADEGAAVRDLDGRTYAAAEVSLSSLRLSALEVAVAMAVSSGATGLEAVAVVTAADEPGDGTAERAGIGAVRDLGGPGIPLFVARPDGAVRQMLTT
ncbi:MAG TPA: cytidine deaminase [Jiangellaceae bacterium]|nr:cytidine deaminase [Jiangellaceae bacterium]